MISYFNSATKADILHILVCLSGKYARKVVIADGEKPFVFYMYTSSLRCCRLVITFSIPPKKLHPLTSRY